MNYSLKALTPAIARSRAASSIYTAIEGYLREKGCSLAAAVDAYNRGIIDVADSHRECYQNLTLSTAYRWRAEMQQKASGAIRLKYGTRAGSGALAQQPQLASAVSEMALANPGMNPTQIHKAISAKFASQPDVRVPSRPRIAAFVKAVRAGSNGATHAADDVSARMSAEEVRKEVCRILANAIKHSKFRGDRKALAKAMALVSGKPVTKYVVDGWTSINRPKFNIPLYLVSAFEQVCETRALSDYLARLGGGRMISGKEILMLEYGQAVRDLDRIDDQIRALKRYMAHTPDSDGADSTR